MTTPGMPLPQAITEYLAWLELDRAAAQGTVREYRADLSLFDAYAAADPASADIAQLSRELIRGYQRHLARAYTGPPGDRRPLATSTRARRLVALRSFLRFAAREEWLPGDLGVTIDVPKLPERLPKPVTDAARNLLLALDGDTLPQLRDRAFILFLMSTGARIAEALRLNRDDWQPDGMRIIGKGDRERMVTPTDTAAGAMTAYLAARTDPSPALFIGFQPARKDTAGNRLTTQGANHICRQVALRLGIPSFHPHQMRHTYGTFLQETMNDARLTAELLGHRGLASVSGYTQITDARRREAREQMQERGL